MEGLEWTLEYYTNGCKNYRWCYNYHYPPLLSDLIRYIPDFDVIMVEHNKNPINSLTQLCYVLPKHSLHLLPELIHSKLLQTYPNHYRDNYDFIWSFCKYFWESHVDINTIELTELEDFIAKTI